MNEVSSAWYRNTQDLLDRNTRELRALEGRYAGATIYVVGSGPQIASAPESDLRRLEHSVCIGLNRTQYALEPTFLISGYAHELGLAAMNTTKTQLVHARPGYFPPVIEGGLTLRRRAFGTFSKELHSTFADSPPTLLTDNNASLLAIHFALILGASRIVLFGVEQQNLLHFYDTDPALRQRIAMDIGSLSDQSLLNLDHPSVTLEHLIAQLSVSPDELVRAHYLRDHHVAFGEYRRQLGQMGVELLATSENSIAAQTGARVAPLSDLLANSG